MTYDWYTKYFESSNLILIIANQEVNSFLNSAGPIRKKYFFVEETMVYIIIHYWKYSLVLFL